MSVWPAQKVRQTFIDYFVAKQHQNIRSSCTIPHDDPTLLFANSGMNQFKPIFQGTVQQNTQFASLKRAVNSQKCIRAGGKHNDLDDVGHDTYHHTFFEMLGNWSFGDYFKPQAIQMAWELLTTVYGLDKQRLYVTYFGGDSTLGLSPDLDAKKLWLDIGVPETHIIPGNTADNFWEMGEVGPCGPCSEIHYDRIGGGRNAAHLVNQDDPNVLEIWNIVFMQYNREQDRSLKPLPNKHIDTGMGMERLVSILQDKPSNYDTDVFGGLFANIQQVSGARPYAGLLGAEDTDGVDTAYRVVADHVRTLTVAITDGCMPSNEGRGYVLRRILRRGARYARKRLNVQIGTFFSSLVDTLVKELGPSFPELYAQIDTVKQTLDEEERAFAKTLDRGERLFESVLAKTRAEKRTTIAGSDAWRLYDTYGFPIDLTQLMADESGISIDTKEFEACQKEAKQRSKGTKQELETSGLDVHMIAALENQGINRTIDDPKFTAGDLKATIVGMFQNGEQTTSPNPKASFGILLDTTNFYAEQGGQINDTGLISSDDFSFEMRVDQVQVYGGYILHTGVATAGTCNVGDSVTCLVDAVQRSQTASNHTATHLLNHALRDTLGQGADQRGSLVTCEKLRFDYACKTAPSTTQLDKVEQATNKHIEAKRIVYTQIVPLDKAMEILGVRAVFGETYPDPVRVVSVGTPVTELLNNPQNPMNQQVSVEFCGGTHVKRTLDIRSFVLLEDQALAKGIRRMVGVTGELARQAQQIEKKHTETLTQMQADMTSGSGDLQQRVKVFAKILEQAIMPLVAKTALKTLLDQLRKQLMEREKAQQLVDQQAVTAFLSEMHIKDPSDVVVMPIPTDAKGLTHAIGVLKGQGKSGMLVTTPTNNQVTIACASQLEVNKSDLGIGLQVVDQEYNGCSWGAWRRHCQSGTSDDRRWQNGRGAGAW